MKINLISQDEAAPMDLLLLADPSEEKIKNYLQNGHCYIAKESSSQILGVYVLHPNNASSLELINIAVDENHQNQGIGKLLIEDAIQRAKDMGYRKLEVGTGNSSIDQLAFYQKCGFRISGVNQGYFLKHYDEAIFENGIQCMDMVRLSREI